jgi:IPT/TIG domain
MPRLAAIVVLTLSAIWEMGCGSPASRSIPPTQSPNNGGTTAAAAAAPVITSISPGTVTEGSNDVTVTINGSKFENKFLNQSIAFWTTDSNLHDHGTMLLTTFVSSTQLTVVIPTTLLQNPNSVQIVVLTGDSMGMSDGFFGYPRSNAVSFTVSP